MIRPRLAGFEVTGDSTLIAFRVGSTDAEVLRKEFGNVFETHNFADLDRYEVLVNLLEAGTNRTPFRARTLELLECRVGRREKLIARSRERFATSPTVIEDKLLRWLSHSCLESKRVPWE